MRADGWIQLAWQRHHTIQRDPFYGSRRHPTSQQFIHRRAEAIDIRPWPGHPGGRILFRWRIALCASLADECGRLPSARQMLFGDAQVNKHGVSRRRHNDVRRLHIAMQDWRALRVQIIERVTDRQYPIDDLILWERPTAGSKQFLLKVLAIDEIHDKV